MAKDKKQKLIVEEKKVDKDKELTNRLIGLLLCVFSAIALTNIGTVPAFMGFIFAYLFGSLYGIVLFFILCVGVFMLFSKKQFRLVKTYQYFLIMGIFLLTLILCCLGKEGNPYLFKNFVTLYHQQIHAGNRFSIDFDLFLNGGYDGGIIGAFFAGLFNTLLTQNGTFIISILLLIGFICLLFYPIFSKCFNYFKKKSGQKKEKKKEKAKVEEKIETKEIKAQPLDIDFEGTVEIPNIHAEKPHTATIFEFDDLDATRQFSLPQEDKKEEPRKPAIFEFDDLEATQKIDLEEKKPHSLFEFEDLEATKEMKAENVAQHQPIFELPEFVQKNPEVEERKQDVFIQEPKKENPAFFNHHLEKEINIETKKEVVKDLSSYQLPPIYLLKDIIDQGMGEQNRQVAIEKAEILNNKFKELNIAARVENFVIGPAVTQYEVVLEPGVRVNSFVSLQEDLKLALGSSSLRLETPIPDKTAIGIEVPNQYRTSVSLKEVLQSLPEKKEKLYVAIGKDISGKAVSVPLVDMPHTLISGATNSGKSVCVNTIIVSLLMRYKPNEVQLIMVDLKRVELLFYVDLPHLMCPIITKAEHVTVMLEKLHKRMMDRFDTFAIVGVKNIGSYNKFQEEKGLPKMSFIILIIDEFAELIMSKKTENVGKLIQKITQLGRAAGIHLILSTQRPSSNVIEGDIKNNISGRLTFRLSSMVDSKVVIDVGGAEKLLNNGDMLLSAPFLSGLRRIQGVYCSDEEIEDVVRYTKSQSQPNYDDEFMDLRTEEEIRLENNNNYLVGNTKNDIDAMYEDIKSFVIKERKASTSLIQRRFQIGYNKAANYMDRLFEDGIVGPENGSKPREVLIDELENDE